MNYNLHLFTQLTNNNKEIEYKESAYGDKGVNVQIQT